MANPKKKFTIRLDENEIIETAFAERCSGPGWSTSPIWVIIRNTVTQKMRTEAIHAANHSLEMSVLFSVSAAAHAGMKAAVEKITIKRKAKK